MQFYLVGYSVVQDETRVIAGGVEAISSDAPKTLREIDEYMQRYWGGNGVLRLSSVQKISEQDYDEYGGHYNIDHTN